MPCAHPSVPASPAGTGLHIHEHKQLGRVGTEQAERIFGSLLCAALRREQAVSGALAGETEACAAALYWLEKPAIAPAAK